MITPASTGFSAPKRTILLMSETLAPGAMRTPIAAVRMDTYAPVHKSSKAIPLWRVVNILVNELGWPVVDKTI
jgi:hypothetical protein